MAVMKGFISFPLMSWFPECFSYCNLTLGGIVLTLKSAWVVELAIDGFSWPQERSIISFWNLGVKVFGLFSSFWSFNDAEGVLGTSWGATSFPHCDIIDGSKSGRKCISSVCSHKYMTCSWVRAAWWRTYLKSVTQRRAVYSSPTLQGIGRLLILRGTSSVGCFASEMYSVNFLMIWSQIFCMCVGSIVVCLGDVNSVWGTFLVGCFALEMYSVNFSMIWSQIFCMCVGSIAVCLGDVNSVSILGRLCE